MELWKLYVQIHLPVAIVACWMCFYYAVMAFLISRRLCKDAARDTPVSRPRVTSGLSSKRMSRPLTAKLPTACLSSINITAVKQTALKHSPDCWGFHMPGVWGWNVLQEALKALE